MAVPHDPSKYVVELVDSWGGDTGWCERIESDSPIPIPDVGEVLTHPGVDKALVVTGRHYHFGNGFYRVQVFCKPATHNPDSLP